VYHAASGKASARDECQRGETDAVIQHTSFHSLAPFDGEATMVASNKIVLSIVVFTAWACIPCCASFTP
jgi:hypothetical protein